MITSSEYINLMFHSTHVVPQLMRTIDSDHVFDLLKKADEVRQKHKKIKSEWSQFRNYPRHDTAVLKEAVFIMLELCEKWGIDTMFPFPNNVGLNEGNWEDFRKIEYSGRYFYKGVEITKIIEF